jgi:hypothetical protein
MRGEDRQQTTMVSYVAPEQRVPQDHPLRVIWVLSDAALQRLSRRSTQLYSRVGRPSIAPEKMSIFWMRLFASVASLLLSYSTQSQAASPPQLSAQLTEQKDELAGFLAAPIDLVRFKKKKGPSNSGSFYTSLLIYRPDKPGFFYRYRMFRTPAYSEDEKFHGFSVVVYKLGAKVGDYYDTNEMLVAIWCRLKDPDLGQADLVGRQMSEITARFGEPFAVVGDVSVYQRHQRALSIHAKDGAVDWFKYVRLRRDVDISAAAPELLRPGSDFGRNPDKVCANADCTETR